MGNNQDWSPKRKMVCGCICVVLLISGGGTGLYFAIRANDIDDNGDAEAMAETQPPQGRKNFPSFRVFVSAAVATDAGNCSTVGKNLLENGGSVVDAAIGATLCVGLFNSHSTSIAGGSFISIYNASTREAIYINARDVAPLKATEAMYTGKTDQAKEIGPLAVAVPGEIYGYWEAHKRGGKLRWKELFQKTIEVARGGVPVTGALYRALNTETMKKSKKINLEIFYKNGLPVKENEVVRRPNLAKTLCTISKEGASAFYNGSVAKDMIKDLTDAGDPSSIITAEDLKEYNVEVKPMINITLGELMILTPGAASGGPVLCYILNILKGYNFTPEDIKDTDSKVLTYHRVIEAFKFAYAKRRELGDENFDSNVAKVVKEMIDDKLAEKTRLKITDDSTQPLNYYGSDNLPNSPESAGTTHISILGKDGSAVSITSSMNRHFGGKVRGNRTGIIFNNNMDDFTVRDSSSEESPNFIEPKKRPLSAMAPTIIINTTESRGNAVKMVVGAAGGIKIPTATAWTIMHLIWFGKSLDESVNEKRLHHEFDVTKPYEFKYQEDFDQDVLKGLENKNHVKKSYKKSESVVQAIERFDGELKSKSDDRKGGYPDGY